MKDWKITAIIFLLGTTALFFGFWLWGVLQPHSLYRPTEPATVTFVDTVTVIDFQGRNVDGTILMPVHFKNHNPIFCNLHNVFDVYAYFIPGHTYRVTMAPASMAYVPTVLDETVFNSFYWNLIDVRETCCGSVLVSDNATDWTIPLTNEGTNDITITVRVPHD